MAPIILKIFKGIDDMSSNTPTSDNKKQALIYQAEDGSFQTEVRLESETIWLSQKQMSELFGTSSDNIGLHLRNIYAEGELLEEATTEDYSVVHFEGKRKVNRRIRHYNLDAIISAGYRVNSKQGTQFRQWANQRLKDYLVKGYAINEQKLKASHEQFNSLKQSIQLLQNVVSKKELTSDEAVGLLKVVSEYAQALDLLDQFLDVLHLNLRKQLLVLFFVILLCFFQMPDPKLLFSSLI